MSNLKRKFIISHVWIVMKKNVGGTYRGLKKTVIHIYQPLRSGRI